MKDHFSLSFHSSLILFIFFNSPFLLVPFSLSLFYFCSLLFFFCGMSSMSFGTLFSSHLSSSIRHLIAYSLLEKSFFALAFAPSVGVILGRVIEGNYQAQRGDYRIIFYISEGMVKDGHFSFQTQLHKLKSNSL